MEYEGETTFEEVAKLGGYLARPYAANLLRLLVIYRDISASEAASRLGLHISTAQEFLEGLAALDIVAKQEVREKKRPYFRYLLKQTQINVTVDLAALRRQQDDEVLDKQIREHGETDVRFTRSGSEEQINSVSLWTGKGRNRKELKIKLTKPQGRFLFHLPLPDDEPMTVAEIMDEADVEPDLAPEIVDVVRLLAQYGVIFVEER